MVGESEVARLRERIALEYQAASRVFTDFTPTARHEYITKRQQNIEACYQDLKKHMSPEQAVVVIIQVENDVYGSSGSSGNTS